MEIQILDISNPVWANLQHTAVNLDITFAHLEEVVQFTATSVDTEEYGRNLYNSAIAGEYGAISAYSPLIELDNSSQLDLFK